MKIGKPETRSVPYISSRKGNRDREFQTAIYQNYTSEDYSSSSSATSIPFTVRSTHSGTSHKSAYIRNPEGKAHQSDFHGCKIHKSLI